MAYVFRRPTLRRRRIRYPHAPSGAFSLLASPGSYAISGVSETANLSEPAIGSNYSLTGISVTFSDKELTSAGIYALTGLSETVSISELATGSNYVLTGFAQSASI